jgi:hypothetical protein
MVEAAELALRTLAERNQLLSAEEYAGKDMEEMGNQPAEAEGRVSPLTGDETSISKSDGSGSNEEALMPAFSSPYTP